MRMSELEPRCGNCFYYELHIEDWGTCNNLKIGVYLTTSHKKPIDALREAGEIDRLVKIATGEGNICFKLPQPTE